MTDRMKNALAHIQAAEVVADKFVGYDVLITLIHTMRDNIKHDGPKSEGFIAGLELAEGLITEVMRG